MSLSADDTGLLVKPDVARRQLEVEVPPAPPMPHPPGGRSGGGAPPAGGATPPPRTPVPIRYRGTVDLDPARVGRDASRIAEEIVAHLSGLDGADVRVTLEISAEVPAGAPDHVVRTVTENGNSLKFRSHGFEKE